MARVIVYLSEEEWGALRRSAERDLRGLREQARYLIVKGLAVELAAHADTPTPPAEIAEVNRESQPA